ncbi:helix-turn-helix transcriptional regulator [Desulfitibacter alkalitolerans]|uniref:helix-turn-helix transcriptional regulator n=1 Tax=Desulfitibacter alkalitolerans TaxID=264641 RepID=UPI000487634F|nr:helix-turn-helix transcriptional regulator [Desulfitibacter alkalitolerans]
MSEFKNIHPRLKGIFPIAKGISETFGKNCEVVIHDLQKPEKSLIYVAGKVTGRKPGAPTTDLVLQTLKSKGNDANDLINYQTSTKDGKILKSSTIFIKDDNDIIIGCMCINFDMSEFLTCQQILESFTNFSKENEYMGGERFFYDVNEAMDEIIHSTIKDYPTPKQLMQKDDKLLVVKKLDEKGVFLVKGSVDQVAKILGVSRYTIYNYLEEARSTSFNSAM